MARLADDTAIAKTQQELQGVVNRQSILEVNMTWKSTKTNHSGEIGRLRT